nr:MerR family transcriptional regulator [Nonomuraea phyllanthi]
MDQTPQASAAASRLERPRPADDAPADTPTASAGSPEQRLDDEDYPAYSMGRAAEILGVTPAFLRSLGAAKLIEPLRSEGGHRRFSRYQLRLAARARELVDTGTALEAACRIIILEDQLAEALRINEELRQRR